VLQFEYTETTDTVENRFIKRLLEEILFILDRAKEKYKNLPPQLVSLKETIAWYLQTTPRGILKNRPSCSGEGKLPTLFGGDISKALHRMSSFAAIFF